MTTDDVDHTVQETSAPLRMLSRRGFLSIVGTGAVGAAVLAACGGNGTSTTAGSAAVDGELPAGAILVRRFPVDVLVPGDIRMPISLATSDGLMLDEDNTLPGTLTARILDIDRKNVIVPSFTATKHKKDVQPYYPFATTIDTAGFYVLQVKGGPSEGITIQVRNPSDVDVPLVGQRLPAFDTPTVDNARGVNPICTRSSGTCPFHTVTLSDALKSGKPVAYLIGTPAYCQTGTCAPALDALISASKSLRDSALFVHAEVYTDDSASTPAPAVQAYNMNYEPALFVTDAQGVLRARLDAIFDEDEISATLASVI